MKRLVLLAVLLCLSTAAYGVTVYTGVSNLNYAADSSGYAPKPWANIWDNSDADTGRVLTPDSAEMIWPVPYTDTTGTVVFDSSRVLLEILASGLDTSYTPSGIVCWKDQNGFVTCESVRWGVSYGSGGGATGGSGTGAYSDTIRVVDTSQAPDDTLTNFVFVIKDLSGTVKTPAGSNTGSSGSTVIKLDNETLTFAAQGNWYYQQTGTDTVTMPAADTAITMLVYKFAPSIPSGADSITVVINVPGQVWVAKMTPLLRNQGQVDTSGIMISPDPVYGNPDANNIIQMKVLRSAACQPTMPYEVVVYNKDNKFQLARIAEYVTPNATTVTLDFQD